MSKNKSSARSSFKLLKPTKLTSSTILNKEPSKKNLAAVLDEMGDEDLLIDGFPVSNDPEDVIQ